MKAIERLACRLFPRWSRRDALFGLSAVAAGTSGSVLTVFVIVLGIFTHQTNSVLIQQGCECVCHKSSAR